MPELLDEVSRGARISITRKGIPVAVMVPPSPRGKGDVAETIRKVKEFRKGITLGGVSIRSKAKETGKSLNRVVRELVAEGGGARQREKGASGRLPGGAGRRLDGEGRAGVP